VGETVGASDPSNYFGAAPGIHLEKSTNGDDADAAPGPAIRVGEPVSWTYTVYNTGNAALTGVAVTDDRGVAVSCRRRRSPRAPRWSAPRLAQRRWANTKTRAPRWEPTRRALG